MSYQVSSGQASPFDADPSDVVAAMIGSPVIVLDGFDPDPLLAPMMRPGLHFVSATDLPGVEGAERELRRRNARLRWIKRITVLLSTVCFAFAGFWLGAQSRPAPTAASAQWYVVGVGAQGVIVRTDGLSVLIAPGELLPNGETLQQVIPEKSTYVSDHATVIVQPISEFAAGARRPAAAPAKKPSAPSQP